MEMVTCPFCKKDFPLDEALRAEILKDFQDDKEREIKEKDRIIREMENSIKNKEKEIDKRVEILSNEKIKNLESELKNKIREEMEIELMAKEKRLRELENSMMEIKQKEVNEKMDYERKIFNLEQEKKEKELEFERKMRSEIQKIREEQENKVKEEFSIKEKEYLETIESLKRKVEDLNRGLASESNQLVGEAQEIAIEEKLINHFPEDVIEPVPRGVQGADIIQTVMINNQVAGKIIWESKRTKQWKEEWIEKLKDDKMKSGCDIGVIITKTMPRESKGLLMKEGIIISEYSYLMPIAGLLRQNLINIKKVSISQNDRNRKESMLYEYIISNEFRNRVQSLLDSIKYAKEDLEKEKMTLNKIWAKRNTDLERAVINLAQIYGTMQGLAGNSMPDIPSLEQPYDADNDERQDKEQ
jgi:hypothetical protein